MKEGHEAVVGLGTAVLVTDTIRQPALWFEVHGVIAPEVFATVDCKRSKDYERSLGNRMAIDGFIAGSNSHCQSDRGPETKSLFADCLEVVAIVDIGRSDL